MIPLKNNIYAAGHAALHTSGTAVLGAGIARLLGPDFVFDSTHDTGADVSAHYVGAAAATTITVDWASSSGISVTRILLTAWSFAGYTGEVAGIMVTLSDGTPLLSLQEPNGGLVFPAVLDVGDPVSVSLPYGYIIQHN